MASNATCTTVNEAPFLMMMDRTLLLGPLIGGGAWGEHFVHHRSRTMRTDLAHRVGILIAVSFLTVQALFACKTSGPRTSRTYSSSLLAFVALVFACGTINYGALPHKRAST